MRNLNKHIFLILSLLALGLSVIFYFTLEQGAINATDEQYLRVTQQRIKQELGVSTNEIKAIGEKLEQTGQYAFDDLDTATKYPYFIYRTTPGKEPELLFWSDQYFVPQFNQLQGAEFPRLATFPQGHYLINRYAIRQGRDSIAVFSLITVYRHYQNESNYLQSGYNADLFTLDPQQISTQKVGNYQNMYDGKPRFLFAVIPPQMDAYRNHSSPISTVVLATLAMFFMGIYLVRRMLLLRQHRHYGAGFIILALYLVGLRAVMLYFGVPFLFVETELFNPKFYSASVVAPSLGDLLLNYLVIVLLAFYLVNTCCRSRYYYWLLRQTQGLKVTVSLVIVLLSYGIFYVCLRELENIYENSHFTLDITLSISFPWLKIVCLLTSLLIITAYFLFCQVLASLFIRLNVTFKWGMARIALGTGLTALLLWLLNLPLSGILALHTLYFVMLYGSRFPRTLYAFRYRTTIYLFSAALIGASMSAYVAYRQEIRRDRVSKQEFGRELLADNDALGEFLINKVRTSILQDTAIHQAFMVDTLLRQEDIQRRIEAIYATKYLDRFQIEITPFDLTGRPIDPQPTTLNYAYYVTNYKQKRYQTQYPNLFFINELDGHFRKRYIQFLDIKKNDVLIGHLVIDIKPESETPGEEYPELLGDTKFIHTPETRSYSYAIYNAGKQLIYSNGNYNYERKLPASLLNNPLLYSDGISYNTYKHVGVTGNDNRTVLVSSPDYLIRNIFANFSFSYLLLIMYVLALMLLYAIRYRLARISINYSTKTQIFLNVAFFLPLTLVVVITLGVISSNFGTNQENTYINTSKNIVSNFLPYLKDYQDGKVSKEYVEEELRKIARDAELNINLFDPRGRLYFSTQPLIYETGYLSKYINPQAYIHLIEDKENQVLLDEMLGTKEFQTAYVGIKSYDGQLLGVLSVPHFDSRSELERQLIEVISTALSVFTGLFLVFLLLSYWASTILTQPLKLITHKIRKTNLDKFNEPLDWKSDDEIGLLIGEYNRMLIKLEEKKQALSQSEKQAAWREMAKQVAHEIKNPLTPMKLTLQHLQRTLSNDNPAAKRVLQRTLDSLLDQIDNLSDIAASFSDFAKMPLPKNDLFEITSVFNKAADLYADDNKITLVRKVAPYPIMVMGDRQLIGRILTNLIINGLQSVPANRKPMIELQLTVSEENISMEIRDNGVGIPEAIRNKIFLPNFSTKQGGSGLGLAIAKRGIEHAGGSIWFETETNEGTTFFITLPLVHTSPEIINGRESDIETQRA